MTPRSIENMLRPVLICVFFCCCCEILKYVLIKCSLELCSIMSVQQKAWKKKHSLQLNSFHSVGCFSSCSSYCTVILTEIKCIPFLCSRVLSWLLDSDKLVSAASHCHSEREASKHRVRRNDPSTTSPVATR